MIIKSHIRGGYRAAAEYMKDQGQNEETRVVEISDPEARDLDQAFQKMWEVANCTHCVKPLHHISINPMKDERLTDKQVLAIVERCEEKYGYKLFHHQRVIVEHIKDGRQHFHVIWNRVSLVTGSTIWPGHHWLKSKEVCREMEKELGLKSPVPKQQRKSPAVARTRLGKGRPSLSASKLIGRTKIRRPGAAMTQKSLSSAGGVRSKSNALIGKQVEQAHSPTPAPQRPGRRTGWPVAAVIDWEVWGHRNPRRFFVLWPELGS